jgi:hypothetical protein
MPFEMFSAAPIVSLPLGPILQCLLGVVDRDRARRRRRAVDLQGSGKRRVEGGVRRARGADHQAAAADRPLEVQFSGRLKPPGDCDDGANGRNVYVDRAVTVEVGVAGERAGAGNRASTSATPIVSVKVDLGSSCRVAPPTTASGLVTVRAETTSKIAGGPAAGAMTMAVAALRCG